MTDLEQNRAAAETHKLMAEQLKLGAEREKLFQEALKLERERWWYIPATLLGNAVLAAAIGAFVGHFIR